MFALDLSPTYEWPVAFLVAAAMGGQMEPRGFDGIFKRLDTDAIQALGKKCKSDADWARAVLVGWKGVAAPDGGELSFTASNFDRVLKTPGVAAAIVAAFFASTSRAAEKKLIQAATTWAQGGLPHDETPLQAANAMGASPEVLKAIAASLEARRAAATVPVWPEHWHAVTVFVLMGTQWLCETGFRRRIWHGLNYAALPIPLRAARDLVAPQQRQPLAELLMQLQVLEKHAADARNARS